MIQLEVELRDWQIFEEVVKIAKRIKAIDF